MLLSNTGFPRFLWIFVDFHGFIPAPTGADPLLLAGCLLANASPWHKGRSSRVTKGDKKPRVRRRLGRSLGWCRMAQQDPHKEKQGGKNPTNCKGQVLAANS